MTKPFDWAGLWEGVRHAAFDPSSRYPSDTKAAAAYLRERIEAAFVPVETVATVDAALARATARAEAAEARVKALEAFRDHLTTQLAEARKAERAAVVAFLSGNATLAQFHWGAPLIAAIEAGEHLA